MGFKFTKFFTLLTIVYMHNVAFSDNVEHNTLIGNNYPMTISKGDPCYQKHKNLPNYAKKLETCYEEITAPNHPLNRIKIPSDCFDPNSTFFPIRYIYSRRIGMTSSKFIQPITSSKFRKTNKAFLKYDFNNDKVQDYIFIERAINSPVYLTACISNKFSKKWEREQVYKLKGNFVKPINELISEQTNLGINLNQSFISLSNTKSLIISEKHSENLNPAQPVFRDFFIRRKYIYSQKKNGFYLKEEIVDDAQSITTKDYINKIKKTQFCTELSIYNMCNYNNKEFSKKIKNSEANQTRETRLKI